MPLRKKREVETLYPIKPVKGRTLGDRVIKWIEQLPVHRGRFRCGENVRLFPFQKEILKGMHAPGITHSTISMPRKLGKSQLAVWCVLARLLMPELQKPSSQIVAVSATTKQAALLFDSIVDIIDMLDPNTVDHVNIRADNSMRVSVPSRGIRFRVVAADPSGSKLQGFDIDLAIVDEPGSMVSPMTYQALKTGSPNGQIMLIGTQSHLAEAEEHWYTKILHDPDLPDHHYRYFLGATKKEADKQWNNPDLWRKVTPALEIKPLKYIQNEATDAKKFNSINSFKVFHLNALVPSLSAELTICSPSELSDCWQKDTKIKAGNQVIIGVDLSQVSDLCALVVLDPATGETESHFFVPIKAVTEAPNVPYQTWQAEGHVTIVTDQCVSFDLVVNKILEYQKKYHVIAICRDHWLTNQFQMVADSSGVTAPSHSVKQIGASVGKATKQLQIFIKTKKLKINNPCLRWNLDCTRFSQDTHGNIRPHKQLSMAKARGHRIDGCLALCNALWYVSEHEIVGNLKGFFVGEL